MRIIENGVLNPDAMSGVQVDRLNADTKAALAAVLRKSAAGKKLSGDDLTAIGAARKQCGLKATPSGNDPVVALSDLLKTLNSIKGSR